MKNKIYVDKFFLSKYTDRVFQHKILIYTHLYKKCVDNVYKFNHIENP